MQKLVQSWCAREADRAQPVKVSSCIRIYSYHVHVLNLVLNLEGQDLRGTKFSTAERGRRRSTTAVAAPRGRGTSCLPAGWRDRGAGEFCIGSAATHARNGKAEKIGPA